MITLITGQPGNGKTAFAVWNDIRNEVAKRIVYTMGIPKLKLPTTPLTQLELSRWYETEPKQNPDDVDEIPKLKNINEGSLIVIDECQKYWKNTGSNVLPEIENLDTHRHHGLDFVILTQYPFLVHKTARVFVSKHYHIRKTWRGRQLLEWPDYQENPTTKSVIAQAVITPYKLPKEAFDLYESASIHTKLTHKTPFKYYLFIGLIVIVPTLAYLTYKRIINHVDNDGKNIAPKVENSKTTTTYDKVNNETITTSIVTTPPSIEQPENVKTEIIPDVKQKGNLSLLPDLYDWSQIAACVSSSNNCKCYGDNAEPLNVDVKTCKLALAGWSGRQKQIQQEKQQSQKTIQQKESIEATANIEPTYSRDIDQRPNASPVSGQFGGVV